MGGKDFSVLVDDGGYYFDGFHEMMDLYVEEYTIMYDNFGKLSSTLIPPTLHIEHHNAIRLMHSLFGQNELQ